MTGEGMCKGRGGREQECLRSTQGSLELKVEVTGHRAKAFTRGEGCLWPWGWGVGDLCQAGPYWVQVVFLRYAVCLTECGDSREPPVVCTGSGGEETCTALGDVDRGALVLET